MKEEFSERFNNKGGGNEDWCSLKRKLLDIVNAICGYIKDKPSHFEMWWWLCRKRELFRIWKQNRNEEDKKYCEEKKDARRVIYMDMDQKAREVVEKVDSCRDGCELFRTAKGLGKERCC